MLLFLCASYVLLFSSNLSNNQLVFLFGVCEQTIANYINLAKENLHKNLIPKFINYNDRSVLISIAHNTLMAKTLFDILDDKTCSILLPTVLHKNRKIMRNKSNCGVSRKNATRQIYGGFA